MNKKIFSKEFLFPVLLASGLIRLGMFATLQQFPSNFPFRKLEVLAIIYGFFGCFLHEKIARCNSSLFEKSVRFGGFFTCLAFFPVAITYFEFGNLEMWISVLIFFGIFAAAFAPSIFLLYKWNPKGDGPYFSVSSKFQGPAGK